MVSRVAHAFRSVIVTPEAGTTVFINEVSTYRRNGQVFSGGRAPQPVATELVKSFLQAMQERDMPAAQRFLHPNFAMCFPGGVKMHTLADLNAWAQQRYSSVFKDCAHFEESWQGDTTVMYCHGSLHGTWLNGETFEGIRFVDRMEIRDGLITRQDVWNDLAEHRTL